jgi:hypothetical protein
MTYIFIKQHDINDTLQQGEDRQRQIDQEVGRLWTGWTLNGPRASAMVWPEQVSRDDRALVLGRRESPGGIA